MSVGVPREGRTKRPTLSVTERHATLHGGGGGLINRLVLVAENLASHTVGALQGQRGSTALLLACQSELVTEGKVVCSDVVHTSEAKLVVGILLVTNSLQRISSFGAHDTLGVGHGRMVCR